MPKRKDTEEEVEQVVHKVQKKRKEAECTSPVRDRKPKDESCDPDASPMLPRRAPETQEETDFGSVDDLPPNTIVCMRTSQTQQWRTLSDFLKDMVTECNISFGPDGMRLHSLDPIKVALVHLHARSEFYVCKKAVVIGMNMTALYRMLRNLSTGGYMLEFSISSDEPEYFKIVLTNNEKRTTTTNKLKLMQLPDETISIPRANFTRVLSLPSADFQRYIRELSSISNQICIKSTADKLILSASGAMGTSEIVILPTASGMHWLTKEGGDASNDEVVEGVFLSKYLEKFSRPLDSVCEIFIKSHYPLVLRYVLSTAAIRLVCAPVDESDT